MKRINTYYITWINHKELIVLPDHGHNGDMVKNIIQGTQFGI